MHKSMLNEAHKIAAAILQQYFELISSPTTTDHLTINVLDIYNQVIYPEHEIELNMSHDLGFENNQKILGKTLPEEKIILIDRVIAPPNKDPRFAFTLAHETGHAFLHSNEQALISCLGNESSNIIERQADYFAEQLLMPDNLVRYHFKRLYPKSPVYYGPQEYAFGKRIYVHSLSEFCRKIAWRLTPLFSNVSCEALSYKLHDLGLITNKTNERMYSRYKKPTPIGEVLKNFFSNISPT